MSRTMADAQFRLHHVHEVKGQSPGFSDLAIAATAATRKLTLRRLRSSIL